MVRLRIHEIMKARQISAYALSKGTNLSYPSAHRLSRAGGGGRPTARRNPRSAEALARADRRSFPASLQRMFQPLTGPL